MDLSWLYIASRTVLPFMQSRITSAGLIVRRDAAEAFVYPDHIDRASIDALPSKPGIYIFWDENDKPLYIGKSVNIRSRVLSHLRGAWHVPRRNVSPMPRVAASVLPGVGTVCP